MFLLIVTVFAVLSQSSADDEAAKTITNSNNIFASEFYQQLSQNNSDNFLVSSFSAENVLALLQSGAKGATAQELRQGLRLPNDEKEIQSGFKFLLPKVKGNDDYTFEAANKVYVPINSQLKEALQKIAREIYYAQTEAINFSNSSQAAEKINRWVEKQTNNKIHDLVNPQSLNDYTQLVLVNALYFKGNWITPFPKSATKKDVFYMTNHKVINVDFMHHFGEYFKYYECNTLKSQFLELKFGENEASMFFALPLSRVGISELEKQINEVVEVFANHTFKTELLNVALPKFKIETTINLKKILSNINVTKIFDAEQADLSGIAGEKGDLVVSFATQKTFIDVNEDGVEAAAATAELIDLIPMFWIWEHQKISLQIMPSFLQLKYEV